MARATLPALPDLPWRCTLPLPPSINESLRPMRRGNSGGLMIGHTERYEEWYNLALLRLDEQRPPILPANIPVLVVFRHYMPSASSDWDNRCKALQDALYNRLGRPAPGAIARVQPITRGKNKGQTRVVYPARANDNDVTQALVEKFVDRSNPRSEVCVRWAVEHFADNVEVWLDTLPTSDFGVPLPLPAVGQRAVVRRVLGEGA